MLNENNIKWLTKKGYMEWWVEWPLPCYCSPSRILKWRWWFLLANSNHNTHIAACLQISTLLASTFTRMMEPKDFIRVWSPLHLKLPLVAIYILRGSDSLNNQTCHQGEIFSYLLFLGLLVPSWQILLTLYKPASK